MTNTNNTNSTRGFCFDSKTRSSPFGNSAGGFGAPAPANTTFGPPTGALETATSGFGLFGNGPAPAPFGSTGGFGTANTTFSAGFGNVPAPAPAPASAPAPFASTIGFGSPNTTFGSPTAAGQAQDGGTKVTPFQVTNRQDGTNTITMQSITAMTAYETKSFEELRYEDLIQQRVAATQTSTKQLTSIGCQGNNSANTRHNMFGKQNNITPQTSTSTLQKAAIRKNGDFGETGTTSTTFGSKTAGGQAATSGSGCFGNAPATAPFGSTSGFGTTNTTFGSPTAAGQATQTSTKQLTSIGCQGNNPANTRHNMFGKQNNITPQTSTPTLQKAAIRTNGNFSSNKQAIIKNSTVKEEKNLFLQTNNIVVHEKDDSTKNAVGGFIVGAAVATAAGAALVASGALSKKESSRAPNQNEQLEGDMMMLYGGDGGESYDDGINDTRRIQSITVRAGKVVDGITVCYQSYPGNLSWEVSHGGQGGTPCKMDLLQGEYINKIILRAGRLVQSITFETNLGRRLGPCGSGEDNSLKSRLKNIGYTSETYRVKVPMGCMLSGFKGRSGRVLDSIGFYFSPVLSAAEFEVLHRQEQEGSKSPEGQDSFKHRVDSKLQRGEEKPNYPSCIQSDNEKEDVKAEAIEFESVRGAIANLGPSMLHEDFYSSGMGLDSSREVPDGHHRSLHIKKTP